MTVFPNAKINLGLNIVARRSDGYHDLETVFYPVPLCDELKLSIRQMGDPHGEISFFAGGNPIEATKDDNLVVKAYRLLNEDYALPSLQVELSKRIPIGAGLGGGSADAAFMLNALNEIGSLSLNAEELEKYASQLGADCAFFIQNKPVLATGIGNEFHPLTHFSLAGKYIVLVHPHLHISTKEAYAGVTPRSATDNLSLLLQAPIETWRERVKNDFEPSVFAQYPLIRQLKEEMYAQGAVFALMSGSGSTVYGIFHQLPQGIEEHFSLYFVYVGKLS